MEVTCRYKSGYSQWDFHNKRKQPGGKSGRAAACFLSDGRDRQLEESCLHCRQAPEYQGESDAEQIAEDLQGTIRFMSQHALRQHLSQLYAFLIKTVQVPKESLEHHLVFKV